MGTRLTVEVPSDAALSRVDRFVADASGLSRAHVQRLISEGRLTHEGRILKSNMSVPGGALLELDVPDEQEPELLGEQIALHVVYEDEDIVVIDKPAGLVTHPSPGHDTGTLVHALLGRDDGAALGTIAGVRRPGIVHRLDRDTSGLIMVAKHDAAQTYLMAQLKARRVKKTYVALVGGSVPASLGRIEAPIGRDPRNRLRMGVVADGRAATTGYRVTERLGTWTLLELDLITGRTHQIRVHLASIGHSVAGDPLYATGHVRRGPDGLSRLFLHASRLELVPPSGERLLRLEAPLPPELTSVLDSLRASDPGRSA